MVNRPYMNPRPRLVAIRRALSESTSLELFAFAVVTVSLFLMLFGPSVAPYPTEEPDPEDRLLSPSMEHPFGTDVNGMDVLSRIIAAPRVDIFIGLSATVLSVLIGVPLGVFAGVFEGTDRRITSYMGEGILRLLDVLQAFPVFILAMVLVAIRGPSMANIIAAIAFVNSPVFLRLARSEMLSLRERPYAEAARSIGNTEISVAFKHLLPNALPPLLSQVSVTVGFAILLTSGLSYVGAGISPPTPELGAMIATGARNMILGFWWPSLFPGFALGVIVFAFSVTGDALGEILAPGAQRTEAAAHSVEEELGSPSSEITIHTPKQAGDASPADSQGILTVRSLSVEFHRVGVSIPSRVLHDVTFSISPGEIVGVIGEPGAGKSVLVRSLLALHQEGASVHGEVLFQGQDILTMSPKAVRRLRGTGIAHILPSAKAQLNPVLRIGDLISAVIRVHKKVSKTEAHKIASEALKAVGIVDPEKRLAAYPHELSGGMAQRVCIALALLNDPMLIIADEPTFGLDVTVQRQVLDLMAELASSRGFAQLFVTRDLGIVAQYCQRVLVMRAGRIIESAPTTQLFIQPKLPYTQELIEYSQYSTVPELVPEHSRVTQERVASS